MGKKKEIFIISSDPKITALLDNYLVQEGHQVRNAQDAFAALGLLKDYQPQIIYIDQTIPELGGERLALMIREIPRLKSCYIVILSVPSAEKRLNLEAIGADCAIVKGPFSAMSEDIAKTLREAGSPTSTVPTLEGYGGLDPTQITQELLSQNRHLESLLECISEGIIEIERGRILYANKSAIAFLRTTRDSLVGSSIDELPDTQARDILTPPKVSCAQSGREKANSFIANIFDKQLLVNGLDLFSEKRIVLLTDITERKRMEAIVEATNLTQNLGYIFSGIRHEIGNPVNSIKMALTVLQKNLAIYDRHKTAEFINRSLEEVTRLEYLLRALKNYSLFEKPVIQQTSIGQFFRSILPLVKEDLENKGIRVWTDIQKDDLTAMTDSRALHHVLLNLITNAADAVTGKEAPYITLSAKEKSGKIVIKVDDNGCGIAKEDFANIFTPFFTSKPQGTGLGLAIVEKMLKSMKGQIEIDSIRDFGTTVTVTLPEGT
ncbi:ATP-binding protein [Desulfosediminicola sp.]|uniref:ATP-binding protein n=1 Tax=Desulfosediminicola sp. TaxID=2886825 RepID=UPI003AF2D11C